MSVNNLLKVITATVVLVGIEPTISDQYYSQRGYQLTTTTPSYITSRSNGIWETTRHNRHNGLLPAPSCYGLATEYGFGTGKLRRNCVMDFDLYQTKKLSKSFIKIN